MNILKMSLMIFVFLSQRSLMTAWQDYNKNVINQSTAVLPLAAGSFLYMGPLKCVITGPEIDGCYPVKVLSSQSLGFYNVHTGVFTLVAAS